MKQWWGRRSETFQGVAFMVAYLGTFGTLVAVGTSIVQALR